jgi:hypothetical protein
MKHLQIKPDEIKKSQETDTPADLAKQLIQAGSRAYYIF